MMVVRFMFLLMNLAVGTFCCAADTFETRANGMADVFYKQDPQAFHGEAEQLQPHISGIKVVLAIIAEQQFLQESAKKNIVFSRQEIDQLLARDGEFTFASIYRNNGDLLCNAAIKDPVRSRAPTFIMTRQPGEAVVVGLQKDKNGVLRVVRAVCVNIQKGEIPDLNGQKHKKSEDEQWNAVAGYYSQFNKKPSRLVRDKYGKGAFCQEAAAKKILLPDGQ